MISPSFSQKSPRTSSLFSSSLDLITYESASFWKALLDFSVLARLRVAKRRVRVMYIVIVDEFVPDVFD
jgi:hypothetical protein